MPTPVILPSMVDWADSFYMNAMSQIQTANPSRQFGGIVQARAWPLKKVQYETFYLLLGTTTPIGGRMNNSWSAPGYSETITWIWEIEGTDVGTNIAANRGDRYRTHQQMMQEVLIGMYPGFCEKFTWSVEANAQGQPTFVSTPFNPVETIWYRKPVFSDTYNSQTGILTGAAISSISGFGPTLSGN